MIWYLTTLINSAKNCYHFSSCDNKVISDFLRFWYFWEQLSECKIREATLLQLSFQQYKFFFSILTVSWMLTKTFQQHMKMNASVGIKLIIIVHVVDKIIITQWTWVLSWHWYTLSSFRQVVYGENTIEVEVKSYWRLFIEEVYSFIFHKQEKIILEFHCFWFIAEAFWFDFLWLTGD